jgi:hypothetical protein
MIRRKRSLAAAVRGRIGLGSDDLSCSMTIRASRALIKGAF